MRSFRRVLKEKIRCNCFSKAYTTKNPKPIAFTFSTYLQKISNKSKNASSHKKNSAYVEKNKLQSEMKSKAEEEIMIEKTNKTIQPEDYEKFWEFIPNTPLALNERKTSQNTSNKNKKK